jgi:RNA polymerase sigma-70 factor (sigma-E family)
VQQQPQGFDEFVLLRRHSLLRTARMLTGDQYLGEDLVQAALEKVWPRWERIIAHGDPYSYVRTVMLHLYTAWWRRSWRAEQPTSSVPEVADADDDYAATDLRDAFQRLLDALSPKQRAILVLRFHDDLTETSVAQLMGCSVGTVKSQTARALTKLRYLDDPRLAVRDR